ncbi:hypothetical protein VNI00_019425 [Paramarasmius palmivorus]|uniref:Uncharacterized protein n=1 Tax=Paramarasmius palmivorus TaxID=297713 RepID=A0AAW0ANM6_9AGAR
MKGIRVARPARVSSEVTLENQAEYPPKQEFDQQIISVPKPIPRRRKLDSNSNQEDPPFFVTLCLLVLIGTNPTRLRAYLNSHDSSTWDAFIQGLIRRWQTLGIFTGLLLSATTTMLFSERVSGASYVATLASMCAAIISIAFGTGLSFVFTDVTAEEFKVLADHTLHMVFLLSIPNLFAMGSMLSLYISITIFAWTFDQDGVADLLAKIGTTAAGVVLCALIAYATWLLNIVRAEVRQSRMERDNETNS